MDNQEGESISDRKWEQYATRMFPSEPVEGKLLKILRMELQSGFAFDPETYDDQDSDGCYDEDCDGVMNTHDNFVKFCKMCDAYSSHHKNAGLAWMNALHPFDQSEEESSTKSTRGERRLDKKNYYTPLTYVLEQDCDDWRTVSMLLEAGADPNMRDGIGRPPLFMAINNGSRWRVGNYLLESGANPSAFYSGRTIAHFAKELQGNSPATKMIWEDIKRKCQIPDEGEFSESEED